MVHKETPKNGDQSFLAEQGNGKDSDTLRVALVKGIHSASVLGILFSLIDVRSFFTAFVVFLFLRVAVRHASRAVKALAWSPVFDQPTEAPCCSIVEAT
eukprot:1141964-Pelagomonas_calceolata.AAC.3